MVSAPLVVGVMSFRPCPIRGQLDAGSPCRDLSRIALTPKRPQAPPLPALQASLREGLWPTYMHISGLGSVKRCVPWNVSPPTAKSSREVESIEPSALIAVCVFVWISPSEVAPITE